MIAATAAAFASIVVIGCALVAVFDLGAGMGWWAE